MLANILFNKRPSKWGLNGDQYLWCAMQDCFASIAIPETEERLQKLIHTVFFGITGVNLKNAKGIPFYAKNLDKEGVRNGMVSPSFWLQIAIPLIISNYRVLIKSRNNGLMKRLIKILFKK